MSTALSTGGEPSGARAPHRKVAQRVFAAAENRGREPSGARAPHRKVAQKVFAAAGNRRTETEGGEPSANESAAAPKAASRAERERRRTKGGEPSGARAPHRRSHKKSLPPPETAATETEGGEPGGADAPPKTEGGEPSVSGSAAAKAQKRRGRELPRRFFITLNVFFNLQRGLRPLPFGKSIFARSRKVTVQDP